MGALQAVPQQRWDDPEMVATLKQTVCKGATDHQLRMFLEVAKGTGLNPFLKEIWFVAEGGIIMAARDGYLRVANENPAFDGMETRVERDEKNIPIKAICTVWRKDRNHPTICEAYFSEYKKGSPVWTKYPSAMISKVAEVLALKRSFSINGVVTQEEIGQEDAGTAEAGSREAQQDVASRKIVELQKQLPAAEPVQEGTQRATVIAGQTEVLSPEVQELWTRMGQTKQGIGDVLGEMQTVLYELIGDDAKAEYAKIIDHIGDPLQRVVLARKVVLQLWARIQELKREAQERFAK